MSGGYPIGLELCNGSDNGTDTANTRGTLLAIGNHVYGAYTQLVASSPSDASWMIVNIWSNGSLNNGNQQSVNVAVGGAGNEVIIASDLMICQPGNGYDIQSYSFPVSIPAGTRISANAAGKATTDAVYCSVQLFDGAFTQMEGFAGVDSIGYSFVNGVRVDTGSANSKGSYSQIIASTSRDYAGLLFNVNGQSDLASQTTSRWLLDFAIGGSGSEQIIVPNIPWTGEIGTKTLRLNGPFFVPIPAGTRIAARGQSSLNADTAALTLYGMY